MLGWAVVGGSVVLTVLTAADRLRRRTMAYLTDRKRAAGLGLARNPEPRITGR